MLVRQALMPELLVGLERSVGVRGDGLEKCPFTLQVKCYEMMTSRNVANLWLWEPALKIMVLRTMKRMSGIVAKDQADRNSAPYRNEQEVSRADSERRVETASLLSQGALHTGHDFENAALVFQHG